MAFIKKLCAAFLTMDTPVQAAFIIQIHGPMFKNIQVDTEANCRYQ